MSWMLLVPVLLLASSAQTASDHERQGKVYEAKGDLEKATAEFEQAIQLSPYEESYYFEAARVHLLRQQFEAFWTAFQTVGAHLANAQKRFEESERQAGRVQERFERITGVDDGPAPGEPGRVRDGSG